MAFNLLTQLDHLAYRLQSWYMKPKKTHETVGFHSAFFHPRPTAKIVLKEYQRLTRTILVTGCFDLLHPEHKKLLTAAKNLGGRLLVGVETDARVRQLKGPGRPTNPLAVRLRQLRQLRVADEVFALPEKFNSPQDYLALIKRLKPKILAVSSSTPHLTSKRRLMKQIHGRVVIVLPRNPKISTTEMLKLK